MNACAREGGFFEERSINLQVFEVKIVKKQPTYQKNAYICNKLSSCRWLNL